MPLPAQIYHRLSVQSGLMVALQIGDVLREAKLSARYGHWLPWLKQNFEGTARLAQNYMRLSATIPPEQRDGRIGRLSLREALRRLTRGKSEQEVPPACERLSRATVESIEASLEEVLRQEEAIGGDLQLEGVVDRHEAVKLAKKIRRAARDFSSYVQAQLAAERNDNGVDSDGDDDIFGDVGAAPSSEVSAALEVLGLSWPCTDKEVKKAYRKLAKVHHPDCNGDPAEFKKVHQAFESVKEALGEMAGASS